MLPLFDRRLRRGVRRAPAELRRRPARQARSAAAVALGSAARLVGLHRPADKKRWLRHLDYYVKLHQMADVSPRHGARRARGNRRVRRHRRCIFTSDHGDMCGSHGLRSKGPFVYDEIMHVPLLRAGARRHRRRARRPPRSVRTSISPSTIVALAGVDPTTQPSLAGVDLSPGARRSDATSVRDHVLFAHDTAHTNQINQTRGTRSAGSSTADQVRALLRRRRRQARNRAVGQGPGREAVRRRRRVRRPGTRVVRPTTTTRTRLVNLAHDRGRRAELRDELRPPPRIRSRRVRAFRRLEDVLARV